jgi:hypothetical protein
MHNICLPPPQCFIWWHCKDSLAPDVIFFIFQNTTQNWKLLFKKGKKMPRDTWVDHPLPRVSFGDIVANPFPQTCHVSYELPLILQNFQTRLI